ncbi:hypothetical protein F5146DRAFT_308587 [Armillaria mellea]|nr:hypothetical protein F5146DRAFT_308587 [Armillaria mellea]
MKRFDSISDQIIAWANKSEKEKDGRTLIQVIRLVFEKAIDEAMWSEMYARLCRKMMEQISPKVQDDDIKDAEGTPIAGGQLFRKYLLNRCQEDFERGWMAKEATAAAADSKDIEDQASKAAEHKGDAEREMTLYSEEYYAAQKARSQGLGLIKFIGELFKLQMLTERTMHECVKKLLGNIENPEEEEIESLCVLLTAVGKLLDTPKAQAHMDVYFSRMKELTKSLNVRSRMQFMLQDILELRERKWVSRNAVDAPTTIAQIHEAAGEEKTAQEKESDQRQTSMSCGRSRRDGERGEFPQVGADGWAVAGAPWPPSKAGVLSKFGQISDMTVLATLHQVSGKSSVSIAKPGSSPSTPHEPCKQDIAKLFQNPSLAAPSQSFSDTSSPSNIRPSDLPLSSQSPSISSSPHPPYPSFVPQNGMRPQQPDAGPNGDAATGSGPRLPQYERQVPDSNAPNTPSSPSGPRTPQMSVGLSGPRMTPQRHPPPPGGHILMADKKHKAAERELLKTEKEEREKECHSLQREVEDTKQLQEEEKEKEPAEEEAAKTEAEATSLPSALAIARIIDDLGCIPYPEGIKGPRVELNINAKDGRFRYDREFLLQFMPVCKEKPEGLEPPDKIIYPMGCGGSGRHRQGSGAVPSQHQIFTTGEPEFGQTDNKDATIASGPQSRIYAGKKDKRESVQRTDSSAQNMAKPDADEEASAEPKPIKMGNKKVKKKIEKNIKKFGAARNLDEAEVYFTQLPAKHHPLLVDKLVSFAVKSKEADAQLVAELFSRASTKNLCTIADFESGFAGVLEFLDDIAIDAPMAFKLMAIMMKGPAFDDEQLTRLALKTNNVKLLLLSCWTR